MVGLRSLQKRRVKKNVRSKRVRTQRLRRGRSTMRKKNTLRRKSKRFTKKRFTKKRFTKRGGGRWRCRLGKSPEECALEAAERQRAERAAQLKKEADELMGVGDYAGAAVKFGEAIKFDPNNELLKTRLEQCYHLAK